MSKTNAARILDRLKLPYQVLEYEVDHKNQVLNLVWSNGAGVFAVAPHEMNGRHAQKASAR